MPKHDAMGPKAIGNKIKSVGLQKLRWYCQMCQKQVRFLRFSCVVGKCFTPDSHRISFFLSPLNFDSAVTRMVSNVILPVRVIYVRCVCSLRTRTDLSTISRMILSADLWRLCRIDMGPREYRQIVYTKSTSPIRVTYT